MNGAVLRAIAAIVTLAGCAPDHASDTRPTQTNQQVLVVTGFDDEGGVRTRLLGASDTIPVGYQFADSAAGTTTVWPRALLCRWAQSADRRAPVFLGAAESGALLECTPPIHATVIRWRNAAETDMWVASVVFSRPLHPDEVRELFESWRVVPVGLHGAMASHPLIVRVPFDSATMLLLSRLRDEARMALTRTICGFPDALLRRERPPSTGDAQRATSPGAIRRDSALHGERYMLASVRAAWTALDSLETLPLVTGAEVRGRVDMLRNVANDTRVLHFAPATRLDSTWVLHETGGGALPVVLPPPVANMDSAVLFEALHLEAQKARSWCDSTKISTSPSPTPPARRSSR